MEARVTIWYVIISIGLALQSLIPGALFGLNSFGMFFAALAYDYIGIQGVIFYYAYYIITSIPSIVLYMDFTGTIQVSLVDMAKAEIAKRPLTPAQLQRIMPEIIFLQSPTVYWILFAFTMFGTMLAPMIWFYGSRKILKKVHMKERIGVLR